MGTTPGYNGCHSVVAPGRLLVKCTYSGRFYGTKLAANVLKYSIPEGMRVTGQTHEY